MSRDDGVRPDPEAAQVPRQPVRPLVELATMFEDARIGAIPVVDRERKLLGIVSYVDVLRVFARS